MAFENWPSPWGHLALAVPNVAFAQMMVDQPLSVVLYTVSWSLTLGVELPVSQGGFSVVELSDLGFRQIAIFAEVLTPGCRGGRSYAVRVIHHNYYRVNGRYLIRCGCAAASPRRCLRSASYSE